MSQPSSPPNGAAASTLSSPSQDQQQQQQQPDNNIFSSSTAAPAPPQQPQQQQQPHGAAAKSGKRRPREEDDPDDRTFPSLPRDATWEDFLRRENQVSEDPALERAFLRRKRNRAFAVLLLGKDSQQFIDHMLFEHRDKIRKFMESRPNLCQVGQLFLDDDSVNPYFSGPRGLNLADRQKLIAQFFNAEMLKDIPETDVPRLPERRLEVDEAYRVLNQIVSHPRSQAEDEEELMRQYNDTIAGQKNVVLRDIITAKGDHLPPALKSGFAFPGLAEWLQKLVARAGAPANWRNKPTRNNSNKKKSGGGGGDSGVAGGGAAASSSGGGGASYVLIDRNGNLVDPLSGTEQQQALRCIGALQQFVTGSNTKLAPRPQMVFRMLKMLSPPQNFNEHEAWSGSIELKVWNALLGHDLVREGRLMENGALQCKPYVVSKK